MQGLGDFDGWCEVTYYMAPALRDLSSERKRELIQRPEVNPITIPTKYSYVTFSPRTTSIDDDP